jgi:hypothetical protein
MRVFDVKDEVGESGEYILGLEQTGSHACYLIYGTMQPDEKGRELKPGKGHEELFLAVKGDFIVAGHQKGIAREGQAIHLKGEDTCWLENAADSVAMYIVSGGHSDGGHH